jgi:hypothetical protein
MRDGGSYSGCKLERFSTIEDLNKFFEANENMTVMDMWPGTGQNPDWYVLYTNFMDPEEKADFDDAAEELRGIMARKREERRKAELETLTAEEKAARETERLVEVGKKCEANHGKKARKK